MTKIALVNTGRGKRVTLKVDGLSVVASGIRLYTTNMPVNTRSQSFRIPIIAAGLFEQDYP